jgi:hypothetical protein
MIEMKYKVRRRQKEDKFGKKSKKGKKKSPYALVDARRKNVLEHVLPRWYAYKIRVVFSPFSNFSRFKQ